MLTGIPTMDEYDFKGKTTFVRVDVNLPYCTETNELGDSPRLSSHAETIRELSDKGAKVVILAHQGRPGKSDFLKLDGHAIALEKYVGKPVKYIDDHFGTRAIEAIESLKDGDILLLENVRFLAEEGMKREDANGHANSLFVKTLMPYCDIFVNDAYSAAHRAHASIVGFCSVKPCCIGRVMQREIMALQDAIASPEKPAILVVGGAKPEEVIAAMKHLLYNNKVDKVLTSGVVGEMFLMAQGAKFGKAVEDFFKREKYDESLPEIEKIYADFKDRIEVPIDLAVEENGKRKEIKISELPVDNEVMDIGTETAKKYADIIKNAKTVNIKGPPGIYEHPEFMLGTKMIMNAIADSSAFSLIGGGHTLGSIKKLGLGNERFSHVTLGGGATLTVLSGKKLPAIEAIRNAKKD